MKCDTHFKNVMDAKLRDTAVIWIALEYQIWN